MSLFFLFREKYSNIFLIWEQFSQIKKYFSVSFEAFAVEHIFVGEAWFPWKFLNKITSVKLLRWRTFAILLYQVIPDHGNRQKRRTLFKKYLLESGWVRCRTFNKHLRSVADKLIDWDQESTRKPFRKPPRDMKHKLTRPFAIASNNALVGQNSIVLGDSLGIVSLSLCPHVTIDETVHNSSHTWYPCQVWKTESHGAGFNFCLEQ